MPHRQSFNHIFGTLRIPRVSALALVLSAGLVAWAPQAHAQLVDVTPFVGYLWGGTIRTTTGDVHINAAPSYGGIVSAEIRPGYYGELTYFYQGSDLIRRDRGLPSVKFGNTSTHYIMASGTRDLRYDDTGVMPFVTGGIGIAVFSLNGVANTPNSGSTVAAFALGGGFKVDINEKLALRTQARLLLPTRLWSSGVYFGTGGAGLGVSGTSIAQGDALLGLTLKLGD